MTTQSVTNLIYTAITAIDVRTVEFPAGSEPVEYKAVLSNIADNKISEPFFHCDVICSQTPRAFSANCHSVELTINIYNDSQSATGSQQPMMLIDQIITAIKQNIVVYEMADGVFTPVGYTDSGDHFQYQYVLSFITIY